MPSTSVRVRPATELDLPVLLAFGDELREQLLPGDPVARVRVPTVAARPSLELRYLEAIGDPARHLVLAVDDLGGVETPLGMALFTVAPSNALLDLLAVHVSHAVVADRHRRRGAGRALIAAATAFADERGLEQIVVSVNPGSRDSNRFFARLGFAPLAVRRVAPVSVVRRRLQLGELTADPVARRRSRRPERVFARRPSLPLGPAREAADPS